jgi:hypothetical protein
MDWIDCNKTKISLNGKSRKVASKQKENPCEKFVVVCGGENKFQLIFLPVYFG